MQKFDEKRHHTYPPAINRLAEQDQRPLNKTYTIGSSLRQQAHRIQRSGSMDSESTDFRPIPNTIAGIFPSFTNKSSIW